MCEDSMIDNHVCGRPTAGVPVWGEKMKARWKWRTIRAKGGGGEKEREEKQLESHSHQFVNRKPCPSFPFDPGVGGPLFLPWLRWSGEPCFGNTDQ